MKTLKGSPHNIQRVILGRVTRKRSLLALGKRDILITENGAKPGTRAAYTACLSSSNVPSRGLLSAPQVAQLSPDDLAQLHDGDVVQIDQSGSVSRLWDIESPDNVVFVTNNCNCRCIMCPQPPGPDHEDLIVTYKHVLSLLPSGKVSRVAFTGGEPTVKLKGLLSLLRTVHKKFPDATVFLLTNGRRLHDVAIAEQIIEAHPRITYCVPLFSDVDLIHDEIVGASGAFAETIEALHNLAVLRQRVELRFVMQRRNVQRLPQFAEFVYRNVPFVLHIAFMGMETVGVAMNNIQTVWIEPTEYMPLLKDAVIHLHRRDMEVSLYNLPLCLIPESLWRFANDSISDWKKTFLPVCDKCSMKSRCPGVFATSQVQSRGIAAIP